MRFFRASGHRADEQARLRRKFQAMTLEELYAVPTERLDYAAFGVRPGVQDVNLDRLEIRYDADLEQAWYALRRNPHGWVPYLGVPISVSVRDGHWYIEDGHHRYLTAKGLGRKTLPAEVEVHDNPILALGR